LPNNHNFNNKWAADNWVITSNNDFYYYSSYSYIIDEKVYDVYSYAQDIDFESIPFERKGPRQFKVKEKKHSMDLNNNFRFATEKEIQEYGLDAYTARILLEKDDDKYQKIKR
jgi:hypothetical protein